MIKKTHNNLYKQCLHVKIFLKKFLNSIKSFLLFSTEISSTEYRDVPYVQYRDVQVPRCPDTPVIYLRFGRHIDLYGGPKNKTRHLSSR